MASEELLIPFRAAPETLRPVTQIRSTLITSSLKSLRDRNLYEPYTSALPGRFHDAVLGAVAGTWLPIELAMAHYEACDALNLPSSEQLKIGLEVAERIHGTFLGTLVKLGRESGLTPWNALEHYNKLWGRLADGGGISLSRLGPKEGKVRIVGLPLAKIPYFRTAFRGVNQGTCELFCRRAYVNDLPALCSANTLGYRISWV